MGTLPPSMTCNLDQAINHVGIWKVDISTITKLAQHCPKISDYMAFLIDIDIQKYFNTKMSPFQTTVVRKLTVQNGKIRNKYLADVELQMAEHKVQAQTVILYDWVQCRFCLSEEQQTQLFNLDKQMMEIVLGAEQRW